MKTLHRKLIARIARSGQRLFSQKAWVPMTEENIRASGRAFLARRIELSDGRQILLSDYGYSALEELIGSIYEGAPLGGLAGYGDYYTAYREVLADCIERGVMPDSGLETVQLVVRQVECKIDKFTYVIPLLGIDIKDQKALKLGEFRVCRPSAELLVELGIEYRREDVERALEVHSNYLWLIGSARGTSQMAFDRFRASADQLTGFLVMYVGATYERGGMAFAFRAATSAEELPNRSTWLYWRESEKWLGTTWKFLGRQYLEVEAETALVLQSNDLLQYCFLLPSKTTPTELEAAILRAVVWLDDASHERHDAMRLLKLWTCAEVFFSMSRVDVTKLVCDGIVATLQGGPAPLVSEQDLSVDVPAELKRLYEKRSRATHGGKHRHVSKLDCERLTYWVSWMLVNFCILGGRGVPTIKAAHRLLGYRISSQ